MSDSDKDLSRDPKLALALAAGLNVRDAAKRAGVSERTAHRRLSDEDFLQLVLDARHDMLQRAVGQLADAATEATATLRGLLRCNKPTVKLGAAKAILDLGPKLSESLELDGRLRAVERQIGIASTERDRNAKS